MHSNKVTARWVFEREVKRLKPLVFEACETDDARFDALIEYRSVAADQLRASARQVVDAFLEHSVLVEDHLSEPYTVGDVAVDRSGLVRFKHAVHEGYSGMNGEEERFARALDATRRVWCWNPVHGGYHIPLLDEGITDAFHPDFLVWVNGHVVVIDTKGQHLVREDAVRKLFHVVPPRRAVPSLVTRFVSQGHWVMRGDLPARERGPSKLSVILLRHGRLSVQHAETEADAVTYALADGDPGDDAAPTVPGGV